MPQGINYPKIQVNIELVPFIEHDLDNDFYLARFIDFPRAMAEGVTQDEALYNLTRTISINVLRKKG